MSLTVTSLRNDADRAGLRRFADVLALRTGQPVTVRFVEPGDGRALQAYFVTLSPAARYNRFTGASAGLSNQELDLLLHIGDDNRYAVIAEMTIDGVRTIVGEARYRFETTTGRVEFGLSVHDAYQRQGIGRALLANLECRAAALGADTMFGDTLRTNHEMQALAHSLGFAFSQTPGDWREVRVVKAVEGGEDLPCAHHRNGVAGASHLLTA